MAAGVQRPLRGSRISSFYPIKTLPSLSSLESAFQLQEYISLLIRLDIHDVEAITSLPGSKEPKEGESQDEEASGEKQVVVDEACWVYEQLRRLAQDLTHPLITTLQQECTRGSCPEMKAGEWLYLCVAHGNEGSMEQCCAIDYILHTLDSATALLSSPRAFPSRIQIPTMSHRHFSSLARRLGRIFAHAYFHHREAFEQAEVESSLYARFLALSSKFELVPPEFLPIPAEAFAGHHDEDEEVEPRGLHAASLEPQVSSIAQQPQHEEPRQYSRDSLTLQVPLEPFQNGSPSPPGLQAENSPRKMGRSRTDTMVPSDVTAIMEELAARSPSVGPVDAGPEVVEKEAPSSAEEKVEAAPSEEVAPPEPEVVPEAREEPSTSEDAAEEDEDEEEDEEEEEEEEEEEDESPPSEAAKEAVSAPEPAPAAEQGEAAPAPATPAPDAQPEAVEPEKPSEEEKTTSEDAKEEKEVAEEVLGVTPPAAATSDSTSAEPAAEEEKETAKPSN